ncbi:hypothetical protein UFOVP245_25 [uncultured Caudovirales phage]|uniref:Uncharacterized protein n=1 Tax=uncultured Caudovirales phage TaxID=2100421 RepID=A0A6J7WVR1_9CAUD|nr:hypothetical protein UFOVP245_25 [uncultured Caudovirales phage]
MNERIKELALDAGLLLYIDHETPRHYFIDAGDDQENVEKFAELIVKECANFLKDTLDDDFAADQLEEHFGIK